MNPQDKIYKIRDEIEELDRKKMALYPDCWKDLGARIEINRLIKHKQNVIARLFEKVERNELNALYQKFNQRKQ